MVKLTDRLEVTISVDLTIAVDGVLTWTLKHRPNKQTNKNENASSKASLRISFSAD